MALIYARQAGVKLFDWLRRSRAILPGFPEVGGAALSWAKLSGPVWRWC
jgi:hypothetical protein